jgi:hypothetical protein
MFHEPLGESWTRSLAVLACLIALAGGLIWSTGRATGTQQAHVEVTETIKAIGTTGTTMPAGERGR